MTDRELMQMANRIEALAFEMKAPNVYTPRFVMLANEIREAIRARLAQPEPEPVAWWHDMGDVIDLNVSGRGTPLYTAQPQREWQGLTDEEILQTLDLVAYDTQAFDFAYRIETKLKEKNT